MATRFIPKSCFLRFLLIAAAVLAVLAIPAYFATEALFNRYFDSWGARLVDMERRGLLSKSFGAAWQDVADRQAMHSRAVRMTAADSARDTVLTADGIRVADYPSLGIIASLNRTSKYSNAIEIVDRCDRQIALIKTDHTHVPHDAFPPALVTALVAAEDGDFWKDKRGFSFRSYARATAKAALRSVTRLRPVAPQGTSTITQQVAKLLVSRLDAEGRRYVGKTIDRKIREMRISAALRRMYRPEEILEVYMNHCVTSDYGLIGYQDIARGLFNRELTDLTDGQCIYLARMVKWGRNVKPKISRQCRLDMPRMARALKWDDARQKRALAEIEAMTFTKPARVQTDYGILVDCANEFWLQVLARNGASEQQMADMNIVDPNSLVRKKGNVRIKLTLDVALQKELERNVKARGYGPDTTLIRDARIGSAAETITSTSRPRDVLRQLTILDRPRRFSEPGSEFVTELRAGDTVVTNIRYKKTGAKTWRKSSFFYTRKPVHVTGQYYAYAIMESATGRLLAYFSRDRIGSRLSGLLKYTTPNGSSTAKPICNALMFDLGIFHPCQKWTDSLPVTEQVPWRRSMALRNGRPVGVVFAKSAVRGTGYEVHNHGDVLEGCQYVFDHLATSNNILGVETVYRLDQTLFGAGGEALPEAFPLTQLLYRINAFDRVRNQLRRTSVTGVRVYKEIARITGATVDSIRRIDRSVPISDSLYSVALGTLELSLYQQMHLFNALYNNDIIERPAEHPSLVIESIVLDDDTLVFSDTIRRFHPFADPANLRPTWLGMHKRLVGNAGDGLADFDIACPPDSAADTASAFDPARLLLDGPAANFAKSGTTDDVIRPFDAAAASGLQTNYGLWNAVLRIDMKRLASDTGAPDVRDITVSCIGECNERYTGPRDGKTLHKFLTTALLKKAGIRSPNGFFSRYEAYLKRMPPVDGGCRPAVLAPAQTNVPPGKP